MRGLRVEIDLDKISDNARHLVDRAALRGVSITAVTKASLGEPRLAQVLVAAGVAALGDSRIENIERMRRAHVSAPMLLLRSPMPSQVERVVRCDTMSVNTELDVLTELATAARVCGRIHDVMIMVELGDLRDGVMPDDLVKVVRTVLRSPDLRLQGLGTNLACRSGVEPSDENMGELSNLVDDVESTFGIEIPIVSGGNSANLGWLAHTRALGRINSLRLGESILLGREPLHRRPVAGLHTDAITLVGEVIESKRKPTLSWGRSGQNAFGKFEEPDEMDDRGEIWQTIVAAGRQDVDPEAMTSPAGTTVLAASSDHLILETSSRMAPGDDVRFELGYSALLRAMTSPFVGKEFHQEQHRASITQVSSRKDLFVKGAPPAAARQPQLTIVPTVR